MQRGPCTPFLPRSLAALLALAATLAGPPAAGGSPRFELRSSAFAMQGAIPTRFTCGGETSLAAESTATVTTFVVARRPAESSAKPVIVNVPVA